MGIEPTVRCWRTTGFEDQEGHQTPFASTIRPSTSVADGPSAGPCGNRAGSRGKQAQAGRAGIGDGAPLPRSY